MGAGINIPAGIGLIWGSLWKPLSPLPLLPHMPGTASQDTEAKKDTKTQLATKGYLLIDPLGSTYPAAGRRGEVRQLINNPNQRCPEEGVETERAVLQCILLDLLRRSAGQEGTRFFSAIKVSAGDWGTCLGVWAACG